MTSSPNPAIMRSIPAMRAVPDAPSASTTKATEVLELKSLKKSCKKKASPRYEAVRIIVS